MKKLMIAAAIVCVAAFAQAASLDWSVSGVAAYTGDASSDSYRAWFINSSDVESITAANLVQAVTDYGLADNWGSFYEGGTDGTLTGLGANQTVSGYLVIVDAATVGAAKHFYVTTAQTATSDEMEVFTPSAFVWDASATASPGAWTAVPEPTSGLLLLLGVAGLALRRRRANGLNRVVG